MDTCATFAWRVLKLAGLTVFGAVLVAIGVHALFAGIGEGDVMYAVFGAAWTLAMLVAVPFLSLCCFRAELEHFTSSPNELPLVALLPPV